MLSLILAITSLILGLLYSFFLGYYFGTKCTEKYLNEIIYSLKEELKEVESKSVEKLKEIDFNKFN